MNVITAAKQIGDLSYFCKHFTTLCNIVEDERISSGSSMEYNPRTKKKSKYVSMSRHMTAATLRNNKRWKYGVIVDGTKLSNRYHIEPFSFTGASIRKSTLRVKGITKYDDGSCTLSLVNWPTMDTSSKVFDYFENLILDQPESFNDSHKLVIQTQGKRRVKGRLIERKYVYNVIHGDGGKLISSFESLPDYVKYLLLKGSKTNEYEERLWTSSAFIDISGCIKGIIIPKSEFKDFETSENPEAVILRDICDKTLKNYDVIYY